MGRRWLAKCIKWSMEIGRTDRVDGTAKAVMSADSFQFIA
jgi:hypothetical protein